MSSKDAETIKEALKLRTTAVERVAELERAMQSLNPENPARSGLRCFLGISQGTPFDVLLDTSADLVRPLYEAALTNERAALERIERKLEAARVAMQQQA